MDMLNSGAVAQTVIGHLKAGRMEQALEYVHPDMVLVEAAGLPYGGTYRGKQGFLGVFGKISGVMDNIGMDLHDVTADGDHVAMHLTMSGTMKSSGAAFRMPLSEIWRMQDGKVIEITPYYFDTQYFADCIAGKKSEIMPSAFSVAPDQGRKSAGRERNVAVVKELLSYVPVQDWDKARPLLHPTFCVIEAPNLPYGGEFRGVTAFADIGLKLFETWGSDFKFSVDHVIADDRYVVMLETLKGKIGSTAIDMKLSEVWELIDGKVGRVVPYYFDVKQMHDAYAKRK